MNCPKHVEFYSKNKFDKLVQLVGFIMRSEIKVERVTVLGTVHYAPGLFFATTSESLTQSVTEAAVS